MSSDNYLEKQLLPYIEDCKPEEFVEITRHLNLKLATFDANTAANFFASRIGQVVTFTEIFEVDQVDKRRILTVLHPTFSSPFSETEDPFEGTVVLRPVDSTSELFLDEDDHLISPRTLLQHLIKIDEGTESTSDDY